MTRHFWVLVHRYAGLYMAFFLVVAGLTGSIITFTPQIQRWLNPPVKVVLRDAPRLDEVTLLERAQALEPQALVTGLRFNRPPDEPYSVRVEPRVDPAAPQHVGAGAFTLNLDPYSGAEISRQREPDGIWPITRQNFIGFVIALHYRLAVPGEIGTWLFGIAALVWTIDCFVSAYLTFPLSVQRREGPTAQSRAGARKSWWSRWKPAWLVKWSGSAYRVNFDLHRAGGLWVWLLLLVLAWSSVGFNLGEQVYQPVMKSIFTMPDPYGELPVLDPAPDKPGMGWREAHATAQRLMAEQARTHGFTVEKEDGLQFDASKGVFIYLVRSDHDLQDEGGNTYLLFDGTTGAFAGLNLPTGVNAGVTVHSWIFALHMGLLWGLPYKVFLCVVGLIVAMLSITGVYIWLKKRAAARVRHNNLLRGAANGDQPAC